MLTSKLASVAGFFGAAVLAAAFAPGATCAFAASPDDHATVYVWTKDLNMVSETGAREALSRIQYAADDVCGGDVADLTMAERSQSQECSQAVVKRTVASMNLPALTAVSEGRHVPSALASAGH